MTLRFAPPAGVATEPFATAQPIAGSGEQLRIPTQLRIRSTRVLKQCGHCCDDLLDTELSESRFGRASCCHRYSLPVAGQGHRCKIAGPEDAKSMPAWCTTAWRGPGKPPCCVVYEPAHPTNHRYSACGCSRRRLDLGTRGSVQAARRSRLSPTIALVLHGDERFG